MHLCVHMSMYVGTHMHSKWVEVTGPLAGVGSLCQVGSRDHTYVIRLGRKHFRDPSSGPMPGFHMDWGIEFGTSCLQGKLCTD